MKTIAHISDLHFGTVDEEVAENLVRELNRLNPDMLINSGDFTQRARNSQYRDAARFIERLPKPQINVPGNHDIPLFDIFRRFLNPLGRYKKYITGDLFPSYTDNNLSVLGINTARSLTWKNGRISPEQIQEMESILSGIPDSFFKIVVTHHPFIPPPGAEDKKIELVGRAGRALKILEECKVDLLLAGHLHHGYTGEIRTFYPSSDRSIVVAQAGTAVSNRLRDEANSFNVIHVSTDRVKIEVRRWEKASRQFVKAETVPFTFSDGRWLPVVSEQKINSPQ
ncbi:metallophosphoesterase [Rhodohalobacter sp. SW132]|uniref:metallophosphoesterase family protein n=1 Tax=Rhodohalobacter sp. SW132 TaxID=2293433 RepID=UPI000E22E262|nr:metallophosphoesterase family protein [Rhodohalobacter sp. SW132]REL38624.1 metallophosphoesterase [Rhodohalobacter sp. SW132]